MGHFGLKMLPKATKEALGSFAVFSINGPGQQANDTLSIAVAFL